MNNIFLYVSFKGKLVNEILTVEQKHFALLIDNEASADNLIVGHLFYKV